MAVYWVGQKVNQVLYIEIEVRVYDCQWVAKILKNQHSWRQPSIYNFPANYMLGDNP